MESSIRKVQNQINTQERETHLRKRKRTEENDALINSAKSTMHFNLFVVFFLHIFLFTVQSDYL